MNLQPFYAHWFYWTAGCILGGIWLLRLVETAFGMRQVDDISQPQWDLKTPQPKVSIIVPALNEEANIEAGLVSLLQLDYADYEIIAVNDRSTDRTGKIMDSIASASNGKLHVIHIAELPPGWLGKPHAMWKAAQEASGDWLLFTDADVIYRPDALRRAVAYAEALLTDHLTLIPDMEMRNPGERMMLALFSTFFILQYRPWKVADPASREYMGGGVFNMIRRSVYERIGTFKALRMEVIEDMKLGKLVKQNGFFQRCAFSPGLLRIHWVTGALGFVRNVTKNFFAFSQFQWWRALLSVAGLIFVLLLPYVGAVFAPGWSKLGFVLALGSIFCFYLGMSFRAPISPLYVLTHPIGAVLLIYAMLRSACVTLWNGGVTWRGTKYPLEELRKGLV
ncbi:MAG TPA: glycosyltransferase [Terriglobales bacterium]|jgi:glycosyltransferase involved in cell wall biosynthesis|nr:glycosyltransferase [Terriglobales bacterium]